MESIEVYRVMYAVQYETDWKWGGGGGGKKVNLHQLTQGQLRSGELVVQ